MRIAHIRAVNVVGARRVDVDLSTPITLFAGENGAGKSSLAEAVRMALAGEVERVALKKEYPLLVTEGAKAGEIVVTDADGDAYGMTLPDGKGSAVKDDAALPFVLNPGRFAALSADDRRTFLSALAGVSIDRKDIAERLKARGADEAKIEKVLPLLRSGFPAAAKMAGDEARDAKAAWRAITGETYGVVKAETWAPESQPVDEKRDAALAAEVRDAEAILQAAQRTLGAMQERRRQSDDREKQRDLAKRLPALKGKLATDMAELESWRRKVEEVRVKAGSGPRHGLVHDLAGSLDEVIDIVYDALPDDVKARADGALEAYERQFGKVGDGGDAEAAAYLPKAEEAYKLMERAVANDHRDIATAEAAAQLAAEEGPSDDELQDATEAVTQSRSELQALQAEAQQLQAAIDANAAATKRGEQARQHHTDVAAWTLIADALSPDGIPAELLASALEPINARLRASAHATAWMQAEITADVTITADGRPYRLLSESEQWRTDAMIGEAIAQLSGWRLLLLDRVDVLDLPSRGDLLGWLDDLAAAGEIDTALLFATLKAAPSNDALPDTIAAHWIVSGELAAAPVRQAA